MMDFKEYITFLSTNGLLGLGVIPNPKTGKERKNLELVKFTINILELIEEKTKGNLTGEEREFLMNTMNNLKTKLKKEEETQ